VFVELSQFFLKKKTKIETQLGQKLRDYYVDKLEFLPKTYDPNAIIVQSTHIPRAQQSAVS
jgi:hypothetical protein